MTTNQPKEPIIDREEFVKQHLQALQCEYEEEVRTQQELLQRLSVKQCQRLRLLYALTVESVASGSQGRVGYALSSLEKVAGLKVGDVLALRSSAEKTDSINQMVGVITRVGTKELVLTVKEYLPVHLQEQHYFVKVANDVSFERMRTALCNLKSHPEMEIFFQGDDSHLYRAPLLNDDDDDEGSGLGLNDTQMQALRACLDDRNPVVLVHGPPGTGKTHTLVQVIGALSKRGQRVLVSAPSNLAVDNVVERLASSVRCVRLGHPARVTLKASGRSYDAMLSRRPDYEVVVGLRQHLDRLLRAISTRKATRDEYATMRELRQDIRERERRIAEQFLPSVPVVCCTCVGARDRLLNACDLFDVVIVDECSQALEAECWIALLRGKFRKVILAGDHKQLPPTVSCERVQRVLGQSLFERLADLQPQWVCMLTVQYRMHRVIMQWSNSEFYQGRLIADPAVADWLLPDLPPVLLIDTAGLDMSEEQSPIGTNGADEHESKSNRHEVRLALDHARRLSTVTRDIAIIVPYSAQVNLLLEALEEGPSASLRQAVEVGTVDSFQGREKDAIIVSFVRSNQSGSIGFLRELRRTNVAVTRARKHLCLIGDSETLGRGDAAYKRLFDGIDCVECASRKL